MRRTAVSRFREIFLLSAQPGNAAEINDTIFFREKNMMKYSRQREAICQFLQGRTDHPTAETIYDGLRTDYPNISLGTVYRNLSLLSETGQIQRLSVDNCDRFDPNPVPHYHFQCNACGQVEDLPMTSMDSLNQLAQAHIGGRVSSHTLIFHGTCAHCLKLAQDNPLLQKSG